MVSVTHNGKQNAWCGKNCSYSDSMFLICRAGRLSVPGCAFRRWKRNVFVRQNHPPQSRETRVLRAAHAVLSPPGHLLTPRHSCWLLLSAWHPSEGSGTVNGTTSACSLCQVNLFVLWEQQSWKLLSLLFHCDAKAAFQDYIPNTSPPLCLQPTANQQEELNWFESRPSAPQRHFCQLLWCQCARRVSGGSQDQLDTNLPEGEWQAGGRTTEKGLCAAASTMPSDCWGY